MKRIAGLLAALLVAAALGAADGVVADHTLLQRAVMKQQADAVDALLEQGASVNAENHRKRTALHYAVMRGQTGTDYSLRIVRALLAHGADPNHTDDMDLTPMDLAMSRGTHAVIRDLLANGADPNRTDRNGNSLLLSAMLHGRMDVADSLREHGARYGVSPRETALLPYLPQAMEFSKGIREGYELNGGDPEAFSTIVRQVAAKVYPNLSDEDIQRFVEQADDLAADRKARCTACPTRRPRLTGGAK